MMKIKDNDSAKLYEENCKNTKTNDYTKEIKCICGSTRIKADICVEGEGAGSWVELTCKRCNKLLYYNGA